MMEDIKERLEIPAFLRRTHNQEQESEAMDRRLEHTHHEHSADDDATTGTPAEEETTGETVRDVASQPAETGTAQAPELSIEDMIAKLGEMARKRDELDAAIRKFKKAIQKRVSEL